MTFNVDGFNERITYVRNSNNCRLKKNNFDNSFAKMRSEERKNMVQTFNNDVVIQSEEARGNKENFVIRNNAMNNINHKPTNNNPVSEAMNRNMFKKFK